MASLENVTSRSSFHRLALALALPFAHACNAQAPAATGAALSTTGARIRLSAAVTGLA